MLSHCPIAFIGAGAMGEAMIHGLIDRGTTPAENIIATDIQETRLSYVHDRYGIQVTTDNVQATATARIVVLAIKPQVLPGVLTALKGRIAPDALVLSIVAGARLESIMSELAHACVVRAMPNTPAQIGAGITVWIAAPVVSSEQRAQARMLLQALGEEIEVHDEDQLDMATALSGSGPAYVFLFMEALVDAGVHLGFPRPIAEKLVIQTVRGAAEYYRTTAAHPAQLRNQVTSPGGTTAEALYYLEKAGLRSAISRAVWAAYKRSVALGQRHKQTH